MVAIVLFGALLFLFLTLLLARYAPDPRVRREEAVVGAARREGARISPLRLRALVGDLLNAMGLVELKDSPFDDERRFVAVSHEPFRDVRYVVYVEADPPGGVVASTRIVELREDVKSERASVGLLVTPLRIDAAGFSADDDVPLELVDGARLRQLVSRYLPDRMAELDGHRTAGVLPLLTPAYGRPATSH